MTNKIVEDLKNFYNHEAQKFSATRKKIWAEFNYILEEITSFKKNLKILDLGCGDGRLFWYLQEKIQNFEYIWVDISNNLIEIAKTKYKNYPNAHFFVDDMLNFLKKQKQQEFDVVILVASFQHIPDVDTRLTILKHIYRILQYQWKLIMINWAFSKWFIKKYKFQIIKSIIKHLFSLWKRERNSLYIPWKSDSGIVFNRFYHIFTLKELKFLLQETWFIPTKLGYIDKNWKFTFDWKNARNSFVVWKKDVLI